MKGWKSIKNLIEYALPNYVATYTILVIYPHIINIMAYAKFQHIWLRIKKKTCKACLFTIDNPLKWKNFKQKIYLTITIPNIMSKFRIWTNICRNIPKMGLFPNL